MRKRVTIGVSLVLIIVGIFAYVYVQKRIKITYIPDSLILKYKEEKCAFKAVGGIKSPNSFIAHAGGGIGDSEGHYIHSNAKEALLQSIGKGFKFIELDLKLNAEGEIFAAHDYKLFYKMTGVKLDSLESETPPSKEYIRKAKIFGKYTPLDLNSINEIFLANPQLYLVIDKLNDFDAIKKQLKFQDRILVEVFGLNAYYEARRRGIKYPMLSTGNFKIAHMLGIPMVVAHSSALQHDNNVHMAQRYMENGGGIMVYSSNEAEFMQKHLGKSATMIYTDFWDLKNGKCTLEKEKCVTY